MIAGIKPYLVESKFSEEISKREGWHPPLDASDDHIFHRCVDLIAYSNNAKADKVGPLLASGVFTNIFYDYSIPVVANMAPEAIVLASWPRIRAIRFKNKIDRMVNCAKCLLAIQAESGSFMNYLQTANLPIRVRTEAELAQFWRGFDKIKSDLARREMPYFKNFTSLCHLLMDLGFDCAKPDVAVMKAAVKLEIVPSAPRQTKNPSKSRSHTEDQLRQVVQTLQIYAFCRSTRAAIVDLYFLIHGEQTGVKDLVQNSYYV